jgi:hypothetical protein
MGMSPSQKNDVEILLDAEESGTPSPWVSLYSLEAVRREMASVYRQAKAGKIPVQDATRLVYILTAIAKVIEAGDLARRVELLETIMKERRKLS